MSVSVDVEAPVGREAGAAEDRPYDISADQFFEMIEAGVFPEETRIYLRDGRILEEMAKTNVHSMLGSAFATALIRRLPPVWSVVPEGEFKIDDANTRLPNLAVLRGGNPLAYVVQNRRPTAGDIGLIVEIAVSSLAKDLGPNLDRYARSMIPTYWVADFTGRRLLAHTEPRVVEGRGEYARVATVVAGGSLPLVLDGQEVARFAYEELMP